jgi:3-dehydroquinate synthase
MAGCIHVTAPGGDYDIHIVPGVLRDLNQWLLPARTIIITNETLVPLYGQKLAADLPNAMLVTMGDGEQFKNLDTVTHLYADLVSAGLDRSGTIIALGGGVVGDTAGFVAATFLRGVRFVQIPTSLLAMVDSSVGGKVGIDLPQGKNLVGSFKQPEAVFIDPAVLATLPEREWRCGMAEVIKHALLADALLLDMIESAADLSKLAHDPNQAADLVQRAVQVKVDVVQQDPYEHNIRAHLNLGHTFAHAIEQVSRYVWLHGEAVGVGLIAALRLSARLGLCAEVLARRVERIVAQVGLPTRLGELDPSALYVAMRTDKKWQAGKSRFALLRDIGQPLIQENIPRADVIHVLESLK